nr:MAG TPA: hypothetical protein [Crassvirales sp.]
MSITKSYNENRIRDRIRDINNNRTTIRNSNLM